jgi:hypothetical protein
MTGRLRLARVGSVDGEGEPGPRVSARRPRRLGRAVPTHEAAERASRVYDAAGRARKKIKIRSTAKANSAAIQCR